MKAYIDIKKDKTEARINIIGGFEVKDDLKARGYRFTPGEVLDYATTQCVNGWKHEVAMADAKNEMAWLASKGIKSEQGIVY